MKCYRSIENSELKVEHVYEESAEDPTSVILLIFRGTETN
jgi:hypothetical protein